MHDHEHFSYYTMTSTTTQLTHTTAVGINVFFHRFWITTVGGFVLSDGDEGRRAYGEFQEYVAHLRREKKL